jgi:crotonobetainyl-CoA:carnitine CoA-transferase CaiB-like acyl-CoA transferase
VQDADDPALRDLLRSADVVIDTPGFPGALECDPATAPDAVWVSVTPFGLDGPRSHWRGTDLGVMAASGNMYCTGDPDRAPVRCTEPSGYAHVGAETAFAALTGLASGRPQRVDVSMQEVVFVANMATPASFPKTGFRGQRRGADIGRTREIWPTMDGFVSYGLRGGKARVPSLETLTRLVDTETMRSMDWASFSPNTADDETLRAIERDVAAYFAQHKMQELYDIACETNLMLAPINSPREILASAQLSARGFFEPLDGYDQFPSHFVTVRSADGGAAVAAPTAPAPAEPGGPPAVSPMRRGPAIPRPAARGPACASWSSAPAPQAPSRPGTSRSTVRPCCASSPRAAPTSCASTRSDPRTRTGSRAHPCSTGSTSASST